MAVAATRSSSASVAPLAAWRAGPLRTVATYRESVAQSVPRGKSRPRTARSNRSQSAATVRCRSQASSRRAGDNTNAFLGGFRLWVAPSDRKSLTLAKTGS